MTALSDIDQQIAELQAQKRLLVQEEKKKALKTVERAIRELNDLGYSYSLVEANAAATTTTRPRRRGIRDSVLEIVKKADGIKPADISATLGADDRAGKQSVANALSALKKAGAVTAEDGHYRSVQ